VQVQRKAGVRIAGDGRADEAGLYPKPMFDFAEEGDLYGRNEEGVCRGALWG
jgi:hypothetical protein